MERTTDVLVIGSGIAGLTFALKLASRARVLLVTKKERAAHLRAISDRKRRAFTERFFDTVRPAVLIYPETALTDNFIQVVLDHPVMDKDPGSGIDVSLNGMDEAGLAHGKAR